MNINLMPIGYVESPRQEVQDDRWGDVISVIHLDDNILTPDATIGLDAFSHVDIIFYMNQVNDEKIQTGARHPRNDKNLPKVGILAQRGKNRINKIGLSCAEIIKVENMQITVRALDAINGTPVLDIKPYTHYFTPDIHNVREPEWLTKVMQHYWF